MLTTEETKTGTPFRFRHLGYGFYWACNLICFQSTVLFSSAVDAPSSVTVFLLVSIVFSVLTHFASAALILQFSSRMSSLYPLSAGLTITAGVMCAALASYLSGYSSLLLVAAGVLTGMGNAWSNIAWFHFYGSTRPERTSLYMPIVFIIAISLYFIISLLSTVFMMGAIAIVALCPILAGALLSKSIKEIQVGPLAVESPRQYVFAAQTLWRIIIGAAIFSVVFGMVWQLVALSAPSFEAVHEYSLGGNLIGALVLFAVLVLFKKKIDMGAIYRVSLPFLVSGVLLLPFLWNASSIWLNALVGMGYFLFDMAISYLIAEVSFDYRVSGAIVCGVTRGITIGCMAFGMLLGYFLVTYVAIDFLMLFVISLCVLYLIGIGILMLFNRKKSMDLDKILESGDSEQTLSEPELAPDQLEQHINAVVQKYHLSRREAEVFGYVARGRSAIYVSETLVVSENTVRSHLRRIYEKLGVHSKQELLDLVEKG